MTINKAAALALTAPIRRTIWRSGMLLFKNYLSLHFEEPGKQRPYLFTCEDLVAEDWVVLITEGPELRVVDVESLAKGLGEWCG